MKQDTLEEALRRHEALMALWSEALRVGDSAYSKSRGERVREHRAEMVRRFERNEETT